MNTATPMFIQSIGLSIDGNTVFENECPDEYVHENRIYDLACHVLEDNTDGEWECVNRYPRRMFAMGICKTYPFRNSQGQQAIVEVKYIPANRFRTCRSRFTSRHQTVDFGKSTYRNDTICTNIR